ncbi:hypothetical protein [Kribbella sp. NPDC006257]|uniref:hypothetical protein n=1 Tax=Kribbella sp. NPDC006257 TaxID=3156738 RepID=UPI0033AAC134
MSEEKARLDELFRASKGAPIEVDGQTVRMSYEVPVGEGEAVGTVSVRGFKREPVQGICLEMKNGGTLEINDIRHSGFVFWMDTAPSEIEFGITGVAGSGLRIWNCWRGKFGERAAWLGSAGLICEPRDYNFYRVSCSDGLGGAEFDAIEFDFELRRQR